MNVYIHKPVNYSDMQGPCPDGYHVPTSTEFGNLKSAGVTLGAWTTSGGENAKTYLKLPYAGDRKYSTAAVESANSQGYYWCSDGSGTTKVTGYGYMLFSNYFDLSSLQPGMGCSIRPFKDTPVVPDSSWTTLYQGTGGAGIFHNATLGLISISSDGENWITIADKNLGATEVYNSGNVSGLNRGNYYQRGNNYGFSYSGTPTTSTTQVDTTGYGPGNYYNSSTFVKISNGYWFSDLNFNLRGGVSGLGGMSELKKAYIGESQYATQGPCPDGYHVPLDSEWTNVYNIWTALGGGSSDGTNFGIALKLPFAGNRDGGSSNVGFQGSRGYYWSSTYYDSSNSYGLRLLSSYIFTSNQNRQTDSLSIRPFKNSQIVPTNSWTKLYGTSIESGGIFWNESEGLISLSSDGTNWVTISDKNLGATTVWNNGDTLSESNCGKYYQRGNNNGFAWTGSVTTSSTKVNAGSYGPGNYYSSSTFITVSSSPYNRDSSNNKNLRGGEDGNVPV